MSGQVRGLIFEVAAVSCQLSVEGELMQFEVNNQMYVVNFVPEEGRWYVLAPTDTGVVRIPVKWMSRFTILSAPSRKIRSGMW